MGVKRHAERKKVQESLNCLSAVEAIGSSARSTRYTPTLTSSLNCLSAVEAIGRRVRVEEVRMGAEAGLNCLSAVEAIGSLPYFRPFG